MKTVIYLHGFNSSPQSHKAQLSKRYFSAYCPELHLEVPTLPPSPREAIAHVDQLIAEQGVQHIAGFIGSSLGGYYSLHLLAKYTSLSPQGNRLKAVLINPALKPYDLLVDYLGKNTNYYSGETYTVLPSHMEALKALELDGEQKASLISPDNVFIVTQTGDEVLDYQQALRCLPSAKVWVQPSGDHAFCNFDAVLPSLQYFLC